MRVSHFGALERIRADELGEAVGLVRGRLNYRAHLVENHIVTADGELVGGFASGEAAADHMHVAHGSNLALGHRGRRWHRCVPKQGARSSGSSSAGSHSITR